MPLKLPRRPGSSKNETDTAETRAARGQRFFFGDDIFISYARPDSGYALALATALTKQKLACFLDLWGTPPGLELPEELVQRLRKSTIMVLIGTEHAARSENVLKEVLEFKKTGRPIIPLTFLDEEDFANIQDNRIPENLQGTLETASWYEEIAGIARTPESNARRKPLNAEGHLEPSPQVITRIVNAKGFLSRSKRLRKAFWTTFVSLLTLLIAAGLVASFLIAQAQRQVNNARSEMQKAQADLALAETKTVEAQQERTRAERASEAAERARIEAEGKTEQAEAELLSAQGDLKKASADLAVANEKTLKEQARAETARLEANRQERIASSRELAASAVSRLDSDPEASVVLARDAYNSAPTEQAGRVLRRSLLQSHVRSIIREGNPILDPSGQYVLNTDADGTLAVRRVDGGELVGKPLRPSVGLGHGADFSPDGKYVVIVAHDDRVFAAYLWEWKAELSARNPLTLRSDVRPDAVAPCQCVTMDCSIMSKAFSSDGRYFAAGSRRGVAWVWDTTSGERVARIAVGESAINDLTFSPASERYLATADNEGQVTLWNWKPEEREGTRWVYRPAGSSGSATNLAFDRRGQFLAAAINPKYPPCVGSQESPPTVYEVAVFDVLDGMNVPLTGHVAVINDISFSPDGQYVLTGSDDGTARVYEWREPKHRLKPVILRHGGAVAEASFDPGGEYVVTSGDRTPRLWKPSIGREFGRSNNKSVDSPSLLALRGHAESAIASFSPDGKHILTSSADGTARVWRSSSERMKVNLPKQEHDVTGAAFSPDGKYVLTTGWSLPVRVWRAEGKSLEPEAELRDGEREDGGDYSYASFSSDGQFVIAGKNRGQGKLKTQVLHYWKWSERSESTKPRNIVMPAGHLNDLAVSQHRAGRTCIATASGASEHPITPAGEDSTLNAVRIWALKNEEGVSEPLVLPHPNPVLAVAFSYDRESRYVATAGADGLRIFDWQQRDQPLIHLKNPEKLGFNRVAFSPDGRYVAGAAHYGDTLIWEWQTEAGRSNPIKLRSVSDAAQMAAVISLAFSPDSKLVLTASRGGTLRLWDRSTGEELRIIGDYPNNGQTASFSQDGRYIVSPYASAARIYECLECKPEETLIESVPARISPQTLALSSRSETQAAKVGVDGRTTEGRRRRL